MSDHYEGLLTIDEENGRVRTSDGRQLAMAGVAEPIAGHANRDEMVKRWNSHDSLVAENRVLREALQKLRDDTWQREYGIAARHYESADSDGSKARAHANQYVAEYDAALARKEVA